MCEWCIGYWLPVGIVGSFYLEVAYNQRCQVCVMCIRHVYVIPFAVRKIFFSRGIDNCLPRLYNETRGLGVENNPDNPERTLTTKKEGILMVNIQEEKALLEELKRIQEKLAQIEQEKRRIKARATKVAQALATCKAECPSVFTDTVCADLMTRAFGDNWNELLTSNPTPTPSREKRESAGSNRRYIGMVVSAGRLLYQRRVGSNMELARIVSPLTGIEEKADALVGLLGVNPLDRLGEEIPIPGTDAYLKVIEA